MSHRLLSLPPDLFWELVTHLAHKDHKALSVVSSTIRGLVLPSLFRNVHIHIGEKCKEEGYDHEINSAGTEIKHAIRRVEVSMPSVFDNEHQFMLGSMAQALPVCIFQFLETLPRLSDIKLDHWTVWVRLQDLHWFARITEKTSLRRLSFLSEHGSVANDQPIAGPEGLESLSIRWDVTDGQDPGSAMNHLYKFLRPSLGTLTHLRLHDHLIFDFQVVGPACTSLRTLDYTTYSQGPYILEAVAEMFPNVTKLSMLFQNCVWMNGFLQHLPSFQDLTHLTLSLDFEIADNDSLDEDHDFAWYRRCFFRRFRAAEDVAKVCPGLQRCNWVQLQIDSEGNDCMHSFVIREEAGGRVVKPIMQWWMGKYYEDRHGGPLPDDMVKEHAFWEMS